MIPCLPLWLCRPDVRWRLLWVRCRVYRRVCEGPLCKHFGIILRNWDQNYFFFEFPVLLLLVQPRYFRRIWNIFLLILILNWEWVIPDVHGHWKSPNSHFGICSLTLWSVIGHNCVGRGSSPFLSGCGALITQLLNLKIEKNKKKNKFSTRFLIPENDFDKHRLSQQTKNDSKSLIIAVPSN